MASSVFSQDTLVCKKNGKIFNSSNQKLTSDEVKDLMKTNLKATDLYSAGKTKQILGNIFLYGGIATVAINHYSALQKAKNIEDSETISNVPYIIGGAMIIMAIPIKIGFSKKIQKAVSLINDDLKNPKTTSYIETFFVSNSNGIGISLTF